MQRILYEEKDINPLTLRPIPEVIATIQQANGFTQELLHELSELSKISTCFQIFPVTYETVLQITQTLLVLLQQFGIGPLYVKKIFITLSNIFVTLPKQLHAPVVAQDVVSAAMFFAKKRQPLSLPFVLLFLTNLIGDEEHEIPVDKIFELGLVELLSQMNAEGFIDEDTEDAYATCFCNIMKSLNKRQNVEFLQPIIPLKLLYTKNEHALADTCWGIMMFCKNTQLFDILIRMNVFPRLVEILDEQHPQTELPILKIFDNFAYEDEKFFKYFIQIGVLEKLKTLILSPKTNECILERCTFIVSNLSVTPEFVQLLMENQIITILIDKYFLQSENVKTEIRWTVVNFLIVADDLMIFELINNERIFSLFADFDVKDERIVRLYLSGLLKIILVGEKGGVVEKMKEAGCAECVANYTHHHDAEISRVAFAISRTFFDKQNEYDELN
ncbi:importin subunit alpha-1, putative [Entamoeba invadens IP1]|uniref:Importin subunit alpha-1, putative n=1 Tax=Entamoeba invadens IP1 TaxID=370355 RepID=A0A0A1U575_ENTIV|nr:importin subunit alpha-1, putative [Entamoeba invadens IP1]ELP89439.1 importin subunit alpha-1, putative [Entamoeba invadens IP1]|eukprot:XP_004256210.1 importin subunit alpha-1, putative [Entamoeba invadens IP1]